MSSVSTRQYVSENYFIHHHNSCSLHSYNVLDYSSISPTFCPSVCLSVCTPVHLSVTQYSPYQHTEERKELFIHATKPVRCNSNHYHPLSSVLYLVLSFVVSYVTLSSPGLIPRSPMNLRMRLVIFKQFYSEWWSPCGSEYYILGKYKVSAIALHQHRLQSLDWTSGLDWWTGLVDWTS